MIQNYIYKGNILKQDNNQILLHQENAILFKLGNSYIELKNISSWMDFISTIYINQEKMLTKPTFRNNLFIDETTLKVYNETITHNLDSYIINNSNQEDISQERRKRR